jgi:hypothetical protein
MLSLINTALDFTSILLEALQSLRQTFTSLFKVHHSSNNCKLWEVIGDACVEDMMID